MKNNKKKTTKERILTGLKWSAGVLLCGVATWLVVDDIKNRKALKMSNSQNDVKDEIIAKLVDRTVELEDLCEKKDAFAKSYFSQGLRNGDSEAARQMAYRKDWLIKNT